MFRQRGLDLQLSDLQFLFKDGVSAPNHRPTNPNTAPHNDSQGPGQRGHRGRKIMWAVRNDQCLNTALWSARPGQERLPPIKSKAGGVCDGSQPRGWTPSSGFQTAPTKSSWLNCVKGQRWRWVFLSGRPLPTSSTVTDGCSFLSDIRLWD